jgi:hypothetical protein
MGGGALPRNVNEAKKRPSISQIDSLFLFSLLVIV